MNEMCYCGVTITKGVDSGFSCVAVPEPHAVKFTSTLVCVACVVVYLEVLADIYFIKSLFTALMLPISCLQFQHQYPALH